jgi:hypothetical protein
MLRAELTNNWANKIITIECDNDGKMGCVKEIPGRESAGSVLFDRGGVSSTCHNVYWKEDGGVLCVQTCNHGKFKE